MKGIHKHPHLLPPNPIKLIQRVSMNGCLLIAIASLLSVHLLVIILTGSSRYVGAKRIMLVNFLHSANHFIKPLNWRNHSDVFLSN